MASKIIIIRGPLGVGKTTIAKLLAKKIKAEYISLDQIMKDNDLAHSTSSGPSEEKNSIPVKNYLQANDIIFKTVKDNKNSFIIDGCFYYQEQINDLKNKFPKNIIFFSLISNVKKCIIRDSQREKPCGKESTKYVHMITTKIREGYEIDNTNLSILETLKKITSKL